MKTIFNFMSVGLAAAVVIGSARPAGATPHPLPFTYPYETLPAGQTEFEFYGDMNPVRVAADPSDPGKGNIWEPAYKLQTEIEYGINDRWEAGFYQVFEASPQAGGSNALMFDGFKWRVRTRLAEAGEWPVDVGLYLEVATLHDEIELEEKLILQRRFGRLRWMANLWVEQEYDRPFDTKAQGRTLHFVINPTTGLTYEFNPSIHLGAEYWARGQLSPSGETSQDRNNSRVHHFLGPAFHVNFGRVWWSLGVYANLNDATTPQPGDAYGPVWVRSLLGVEL